MTLYLKKKIEKMEIDNIVLADIRISSTTFDSWSHMLHDECYNETAVCMR